MSKISQMEYKIADLETMVELLVKNAAGISSDKNENEEDILSEKTVLKKIRKDVDDNIKRVLKLEKKLDGYINTREKNVKTPKKVQKPRVKTG